MDNNLKINFHKSFQQTESFIASCHKISSVCNHFDQQKNPFFIDEEYDSLSRKPWLYYATLDTEMIGFLSVYVIDAYNVEICCFVLPEYRRKKVATNLFSRMVVDYDCQSFQLSMATGNKTGKAFATKMGFEYCSTECSMQLDKKNFSVFKDTLSLIPEKQNDEISVCGNIDGTEVGRSVISVFNNTVCIHNVEIYEEYRGKGYGYLFIGTLLNHIFAKYDTAILHVTKENAPAYGLYRKIGFETVQELEYYEL